MKDSMNRLLLSLLIVFYATTLKSQLQYIEDGVMDGYTLFSGQQRTFLINNCGEIINTWNFVNPKYHVKLLPNGNIIYIDWLNDQVVERDWDDNIVSTTFPQDPDITLDYEVIVLDNGNYLCLARRTFSMEDFLNIGYNLSLGSPTQVDIVVELDPSTGETVWEWNIADHVIHDLFPPLPNFGSVFNHPELLNMDAISTFDWTLDESFMINGMDYNPALDQIALSVRKMGEVIIIDHSTTTEEAAGHTGGRYGKGGDILYRWGNPENYYRGTAINRHLYYQHNPNWIMYGEHKGQMIMYNNGLARPDVSFGEDYSNVPIIELPIDGQGNYTITDPMSFGPYETLENYGLPSGDVHFYSPYTSAAKVLPNENIMITVGGDNRVIELLADGTRVWEYQLATAFFTFRAEKYPTEYPAFEGRDLTPGETIESPPSNVPCLINSSTAELSSTPIKAWMNDSRELVIQTEELEQYQLILSNVAGQVIKVLDSNEADRYTKGQSSFKLSENLQGLYILSIQHEDSNQIKSLKIFIP